MDNNIKKQEKITLKQKLWFRFEETLTKGTIAIIAWLTILTILLSIVFGAILFLVFGKTDGGYSIIEATWQSFLHIIDTGTISTDETWGYRIIALFSTMIGVFIFSALISVLTAGLDKIFIELRKGKSKVILRDYTLILGWSPSIFKIISELILANANHKNKAIVILAPKDKIEMEDEISMQVNQSEIIRQTYLTDKKNKTKYHKTKILCRTGNPIDLSDLKMINTKNASSIIILPTDDVNSDTTMIKCILALEGLNINKQIVTEIKSLSNKNAIDFCLKGKDTNNKIYIPSTNWLSKVTAQTSRQSGYSVILTELLNYESNEIYVLDAPNEIIGKSFESVLVACSSSVVLGIKKKYIEPEGFIDQKDYQKHNNFILNPLVKCPPNSKNRKIEKGDKLILLQLDDFRPEFNQQHLNFEINNKPENTFFTPLCQNILILGWNERIYSIIDELFGYIDPKSEILIVADTLNENELLQEIEDKTIAKSKNIKILKGDTADYKILISLDIFKFESIIILGYDNLDIQQKDAKSILTILQIRQILQQQDKNIVAEIYDEKNREIVELSKACDYIISDNIISLLMTQLSQQPDLYWIFEELFDDNGCEIYLKTIDNYISDFKKEYDFNDLTIFAACKNEITLGYRVYKFKDEKKKNYGVVLNPDKNKKLKFERFDSIIVICKN
jgi:hypothetical protein